MITTTSSTASTVRSAVLNGVFSGTRSMASWIRLIFMQGPWGMEGKGGSASGPQVDDVGGALDVAGLAIEAQGLERRDRNRIEVQRAQSALAVGEAAAAGVVDHVGPAIDAAQHHHHVAGDVDQ